MDGRGLRVDVSHASYLAVLSEQFKDAVFDRLAGELDDAGEDRCAAVVHSNNEGGSSVCVILSH